MRTKKIHPGRKGKSLVLLSLSDIDEVEDEDDVDEVQIDPGRGILPSDFE